MILKLLRVLEILLTPFALLGYGLIFLSEIPNELRFKYLIKHLTKKKIKQKER